MLKKALSLSLLIAILLVHSICTISVAAAEYVFYVSPQGNDNNPGTITQPFATIERAKEKVREISGNMTSDVTVYLRGGEYFLNNTLKFEAADSGKNGFKIEYKAYPGETPIINGGTVVSGWTKDSGNIYKAYVGTGVNFLMISENGEIGVPARYPNTGYSRMAAHNNSKNQFKFNVGDIPYVENVNELQVYCWAGGPNGEINWWTDLLNVNSIDYTNRIVTLAGNASHELGGGSRYYVQGAKELLDAPGEFYLDKATGMLYYYPRKLPVEDQTIVIPKAKGIIAVTGTRNNPVRNISFEGITIRNCDYNNHGITIVNADNITVKDCRINNVGGDGIYIGDRAQNNTIYGNDLYHIGFNGIHLNGPNDAYVNKQNTVMNNRVRYIGMFEGGKGGIAIWQSGENVISHNKVSDTPRYSIILSSPRLGASIGQTFNGITITQDNIQQVKRNALNAKDNIIEYNDLSNANTDSQDTGVFYTWGASAGGNIVRNNEIHDSNIQFSFGYGLYLDDCADDFQVYNNIIHHLQTEQTDGVLMGAMMVKGIGNKIFNNIMVDNNNGPVSQGNAAIVVQELADDAPTINNEIQRNIIAYNVHPNIYRFLNGRIHQADTMLGKSDYNLYYNTSNNYRVSGVPNINVTSLDTWKQLYNGKYDNRSVTAAPLFMNRSERDYRIKRTSPAYALGFEDINMEDIGLLEDFKYGDPEETLDRIFIRSSQDTVNKSWIDLHVGQSATLELSGRTVSGFVANLNNAQISYSSSNSNIVQVSETGVMKALKEGDAEITATVTKGNVTKSIKMDVHVENHPASSIIENVQTKDGHIVSQSGFVPVGTDEFIINFKAVMDQSTLNKENIKVFKGQELADYTLIPAEKSCRILFTTPVGTGESYRLILNTNIKTLNNQSLVNEVVIAFDSSSEGFNISGVRIRNINGEEVHTIESSALIFASVDLYNNAQENTNAICILGLYDSQGKLKELSFSEKSIDAFEFVTLGAAISTPVDAGGYTLKVFIWDGLDSKRPLVRVKELRNQ